MTAARSVLGVILQATGRSQLSPQSSVLSPVAALLFCLAVVALAAFPAAGLPPDVSYWSDGFSYPEGQLPGCDGWTGNATYQSIKVYPAQTSVMIECGDDKYAENNIGSYCAGGGRIWISVRVKPGGNAGQPPLDFWRLRFIDPAGADLAAWGGAWNTCYGQTGAGATSVSTLTTGLWTELTVLIDTAADTSTFYVDGSEVGILSHTGADCVQKVRFERYGAGYADHWMFFDDLDVGGEDVPGPVTEFAATAESARVLLTWRNPPYTAFTGTMIRFRTDTYPLSSTDGALVCDEANAPGSQDSYAHTGLTNGTTYYYSAFAHDGSGNYQPAANAAAIPVPLRDLKSDTWVAADGLGRTLEDYTDCGPTRPGKFVGFGYEPWFLNTSGADLYGPYNIREMEEANPNNPQYGPFLTIHYWDEPELGYYLSDDEYVIRKHAQMLTDLGADTIIVDVTNALIYPEAMSAILNVFRQMRGEGNNTPQIVFFACTGTSGVVQSLYDMYYAFEPDSDLWFRWEGKPLLLTCSPEQVPPALQSFFATRKTWGLMASIDEPDEWSFMQLTPQPWGYHTPGVPEEIAVSAAQQETYMSEPTAHGRSYRNGSEPPVWQRNYFGYNFIEQWQRALSVDPDFAFAWCWNQWTTFRFLIDGKNIFHDVYSEEFSSDIEPMKGGHTDTYYYQVADYIRRFKGVRSPDAASAIKTITVDGDFADWDTVGPEFPDTIGDTAHRDHLGWGFSSPGVRTHYTDTSGRNDFVRFKSARDFSYVYFYAETAQNITSYTDPNWMLLFIDADGNSANGWHGYDYLVNSQVTDSSATTLKRSLGGWNWTDVSSVSYRVIGNKMEVRIPKMDLGLTGTNLTLDFHWADNPSLPIQGRAGEGSQDDIIQFGVSGDSAPNRGFNYRYTTGSPYLERFDYTLNSNLAGDGGWTGTAGQEIKVDPTLPCIRMEGGSTSTYAANSLAVCKYGAGGRISVKLKAFPGGSGTGYTMWSLWIDDSLGRNLARWQGQATTCLGRIGGTSNYTTEYSLNTGVWNDLNVEIDTAANTSQFFLNGVSIGTLSHTSTAAGDSVCRLKFERLANAPATGHTVFFDDLSVDGSDRNSPIASIGPASTGVTRDGPVSYSVNFGETVAGFDSPSDINISLTGSAAVSSITLSGSGPGPYTVTLSQITGNGTIAIAAPSAACVDTAGNANAASAQSESFVVDNAAPVTTASPPGGVYNTSKSVTLAADESAATYYTTDGSVPTTGSNVYSAPVQVAADTTLRFFSVDTAGNAETTRQEVYHILSQNGSVAAVKQLTDGEPVSLGDKVLYLKRGGFGYIEEPVRINGIRVQGDLSAGEDNLVCLVGSMRKPPGQEPYIDVSVMTPNGPLALNPLGANNKELRRSMMDGLYVAAWGYVKTGSLAADSYVIGDGADVAGIKVVTVGLPDVMEGQFVIVSGAAGFDQTRVIYSR
ncbi:MAG: chitobiase/beta-hexosaminidase C-terminal domain-containing protein [Armatimonadota bacterium]|nr:chitobiase/beta-hexosaminidase C-terminal domain-containing protein [Armatimonadota bacterium]